jgi:hypothetical protein
MESRTVSLGARLQRYFDRLDRLDRATIRRNVFGTAGGR